jgi:hypothetical protein
MIEDIEDRIRRKAHEIWEREGQPHGRHHEHWLLAEAALAALAAPRPATGEEAPALRPAGSRRGSRAGRASAGSEPVQRAPAPTETAPRPRRRAAAG